MARRGVELAMVAAGVVIASALPVLASLYIAHRNTVDDEEATARAAAQDVLHRVDALGAATDAAYLRLAADRSAPCSPSHIQLMRDVDLVSAAVQATGHVVDGRLDCSSLGDRARGASLGPVTYVTPRGVRVRTSVDLGLANRKRFLVLEYGGYAIAILPDYLVDIGDGDDDIAIGAYSTTGAMLARRGAFDPAWRTRMGEARAMTFYDGRHMVVLRRSPTYNVVGYAALPTQRLKSRLHGAVLALMPVGAALGLVSALAAFWLLRQRASLPNAMRAGLRRGEFSLHYQPIVRLEDRRIAGVEALIRWERADECVARPDVFIPVAEACGLIRRISAFILEQLAEDLPRIVAALPGCYVSLNFSSIDLQSPETVPAIRRLLERTGVAPSTLVIEATEHSLIEGDTARDVVHALRALSVRIAIDDFGTGYSSLSYLTKMECDILKIDRIFIDAAGTDSVTADVVLHILQLARTLELKVVAEGVESESQARFLREQGADYAQGWLFSKPKPLAALLADA